MMIFSFSNPLKRCSLTPLFSRVILGPRSALRGLDIAPSGRREKAEELWTGPPLRRATAGAGKVAGIGSVAGAGRIAQSRG